MNDYIDVDYSEAEEALKEAAETLEEAGYETRFLLGDYSQDILETASEDGTEEAFEEFFDDLKDNLGMEVEGVPEEQRHVEDRVYVNLTGDEEEPYRVHTPTPDAERREKVEELLGV